MSGTRHDIKLLLREGIIALIPVNLNGLNSTCIYTLQDQYEDPRSVNWLMKTMAAHYWMELAELKRYYSRFLGLRHNISIPLDANLVLLPVKTRSAVALGEITVGYMNLLQVQDIVPVIQAPAEEKNKKADRSQSSHQESKGGYLSLIHFSNGFSLHSLNTPATLQERLRQGRQVRSEFLRRKQGSVPYLGITIQDILEILPPCECILKEYFLFRFDKKNG